MPTFGRTVSILTSTSIWPPSYRCAESVCVAGSGSTVHRRLTTKFPNALSLLRPWLGPLETDYGVCSRLNETGLAKRFPAKKPLIS